MRNGGLSVRTGGAALAVLLVLVLLVLSVGARAGATGRCGPLDPVYSASWRTDTVRSAGCHAWRRLHRHHRLGSVSPGPRRSAPSASPPPG